MNPYVERFDRSIREESVDAKEVNPYPDIKFNRGFTGYLIFYNTKRIQRANHGAVVTMNKFRKILDFLCKGVVPVKKSA